MDVTLHSRRSSHDPALAGLCCAGLGHKWMPVSRSRNGAARDGYIAMIPAAGFSGTPILHGPPDPDEDARQIKRWKAIAATCVRCSATASPAISHVGGGNDRLFSTGHTIVGNCRHSTSLSRRYALRSELRPGTWRSGGKLNLPERRWRWSAATNSRNTISGS